MLSNFVQVNTDILSGWNDLYYDASGNSAAMAPYYDYGSVLNSQLILAYKNKYGVTLSQLRQGDTVFWRRMTYTAVPVDWLISGISSDVQYISKAKEDITFGVYMAFEQGMGLTTPRYLIVDTGTDYTNIMKIDFEDVFQYER